MMSRALSYRRFVLVAVAAVGAAGVFAAVSTVAARSARHEVERRPIIILLHGRGQLGRDTARVRAEWQNALETGIWALTKRPLIDSGDVRLVWYADILDPTSSAGGCDATARASRRQRSEPAAENDGDVLQLLLGVTSTLFTSLYESMPEESRYSMRALVGDVLYLGDRWRRCAVDRRLDSALAHATRESRPVILVAHSFGSLVAYSYLRSDRPRAQTNALTIHRFVTLGSMLGIPELQELLLGRAGPLFPPPGVRSWVNVRHLRDPFAASLADSTGRQRTTIREVVTSGNAADPHDIVAYLRDPAAARAIAWAWCDAFEGTRPPACSDIRRDVP
ncbi:MAG: hypothetical protein ABR499_07675 [Gemmatimonadaceae bacterium]